MRACPRCGGNRLADHKFRHVPFRQVAASAIDAGRDRRISDAVSEVIAWIGLQAANAARKPHECNHCGWVF